AGAQAVTLTTQLGLATGRQGRVVVTPMLEAAGHAEVFVIGDAAYLEHDGAPLPMIAPIAIQMAETAARNIERRLRGEAPLPFRYKDRVARHDRPQRRRRLHRRDRVQRVHRVGGVADRAYPPAHRLPQQAVRADELVLGLL